MQENHIDCRTQGIGRKIRRGVPKRKADPLIESYVVVLCEKLHIDYRSEAVVVKNEAGSLNE